MIKFIIFAIELEIKKLSFIQLQNEILIPFETIKLQTLLFILKL